MIPKILHRTLPAEPKPDVAGLWQTVLDNTVGWEHRTYQSPRDPADWPMTGHLFSRCHNRAQEADLVRLEALWEHGGVYFDSDVSLCRPIDLLLRHRFFVGWEHEEWLGTAVIGAVPKHPAIQVALQQMMEHVRHGGGMVSSPRLLTPVWEKRSDVTRLPRKAFYPTRYQDRDVKRDWSGDLQVYGVHHWHGSWL
jgi:mannosyltransferase OCH1-like enzyme